MYFGCIIIHLFVWWEREFKFPEKLKLKKKKKERQGVNSPVLWFDPYLPCHRGAMEELYWWRRLNLHVLAWWKGGSVIAFSLSRHSSQVITALNIPHALAEIETTILKYWVESMIYEAYWIYCANTYELYLIIICHGWNFLRKTRKINTHAEQLWKM